VNLDLIIVVGYSYILGSIPFGLIVTKIYLKKDVRDFGSGNIGATNVLRTGKKTLAALTLLLDVMKGYISIHLSLNYFSDLVYLAGLASLLGHIFPIWLKFKGGKGVAPYLGIILGLSFKFAIVFCATWLIVLYLFKYSSLSSVFSSLIVLFYSLIIDNFYTSFYLFIASVIILYTHKENIIRLKNKTENKIKF
jgi:glycerol-3-phosphate acyltransferase PlsY